MMAKARRTDSGDWPARLDALGEAHGWNRSDLALLLRASPHTFRNWERGISTPDPRFRRAIERLERGQPAYDDQASPTANREWANRVRALREARGWRNRDLAEALHASVSTVENWQGSNPKRPARRFRNAIERLEQHHDPYDDGPLIDRPDEEADDQPERIRRLRAAFGWTQQRLADELDVSQSMIGQVQNGRNRLGERAEAILSQLEAQIQQRPTAPAHNLGERLSSLRRRLNITQDDLAAAIGTNQSTISLWENGLRGGPSPRLLDRLDRFERGELDLRAVERPPGEELLAALPERLPVQGLRKAVDRLLATIKTLEPREPGLRPIETSPEEAADEIRWLARVSSPPVPVKDIIERCGFHWQLIDVDLPLTGMAVETTAGPLVAVNARLGTHAHEAGDGSFSQGLAYPLAYQLGHLLLRHVDRLLVDVAASGIRGRLRGISARVERDADEFAQRLLMPGQWLEHDTHADVDIPRLAGKYAVDELTMALRLAWLGIAPAPMPGAQRR